MALQLYRRHTSACTGKRPRHDRSYRRCKCPIHAEGTLRVDGFIRQATGKTEWDKAEQRKREWEDSGTVHSTRPAEAPTLQDVCRAFLEDAKARNLTPATLGKYHVLLNRQLLPYAQEHGTHHVAGFDLNAVGQFRATWKDGAIASKKKLERLRTFFRFAVDREWMASNPAAKLKMPQVDAVPTLPFTEEEMVSILSACLQYKDNYGRTGQANAVRLRAFVLLLRYSGLRIGDATSLRQDRLTGSKLLLYTQKTGVPVYVPLPPVVVSALQTLPSTNRGKDAPPNSEYFFWTGCGLIKTAVADWQRSLRKLFRLAGLWEVPGKQNGHAHRFRDTFAVSLLERDVPIETVSVLLGHSSVAITEKHYAPWVHTRQQRLEEAVRRTWPVTDVPENAQQSRLQ